MSGVTQAMPVVSTLSRGTILKRVFVIGYLTAIAVATVGWVSAFGWITVKFAKWLLGLDQILCYPAADHDPKCKIYFQRDQHRASPHF